MAIKMIKINGIPTAVVLENVITVRPITPWASEITFVGGTTLTVDTEFCHLMKHLYGVKAEDLMKDAEDSEKIEIAEETPIEECGFSVRTFNVLKRGGINTVGDLKEKDVNELKNIRMMGRSIEEVQKFLSKIKE